MDGTYSIGIAFWDPFETESDWSDAEDFVTGSGFQSGSILGTCDGCPKSGGAGTNGGRRKGSKWRFQWQRSNVYTVYQHIHSHGYRVWFSSACSCDEQMCHHVRDSYMFVSGASIKITQLYHLDKNQKSMLQLVMTFLRLSVYFGHQGQQNCRIQTSIFKLLGRQRPLTPIGALLSLAQGLFGKTTYTCCQAW